MEFYIIRRVVRHCGSTAAILPQILHSIILSQYCNSTAAVLHSVYLLQYSDKYLFCSTVLINWIATIQKIYKVLQQYCFNIYCCSTVSSSIVAVLFQTFYLRNIILKGFLLIILFEYKDGQ